MIISLAIFIFVVVAGFTSAFPSKVPQWVYPNLEYFIVVVALIGILTAIAQVESESRKTEALQLTNNAEQIFGSILGQIEYRMDRCEVWWNTALDQTNKAPEACHKSDACAETCRTAHMISQYRWRPIETEMSDWENFHSRICSPPEADPICKDTTSFIEILKQAKSTDATSDNQFFSNEIILIIVQLLTGLGLGLELSKIRSKKKSEKPVSEDDRV